MVDYAKLFQSRSTLLEFCNREQQLLFNVMISGKRGFFAQRHGGRIQ